MPQLREICQNVGRLEHAADGLIQVGRVDHDSRAVDETSLFMALAGRQTSGHKYVAQALSRGAVAIGVEEGSLRPENAPTVVWFKTARKDMATVAARVVNDPQNTLDIVAVTGTNGKTSVTTILHAILQQAGIKSGLIGTVSTRIGNETIPMDMTTPESTDLYRLLGRMRDHNVQIVCMEYSSVGIEEHRVEGTRPHLALYLNLTQDHLDYHGTMLEYGAAKAKLFTAHLAEGGTALVSVDDTFGQALYNDLKEARPDIDCLSVSIRNCEADVVGQLKSSSYGIAGEVRMLRTRLQVETVLLGDFNCQNVTMAIAAARILNICEQDIVSGLKDCSIPGRLEHVPLTSGPKVVVDYAHTPQALLAAIDALRPLVEGRLICVFGCGGDRDASKRPLMGAAASGADLVFITSDNPRWESADQIIRDILPGLDGGTEHRVEPDRQCAIETALDCAQLNDVVLIAGKGHEGYQEIEGRRLAFSDRQCVLNWKNEGIG